MRLDPAIPDALVHAAPHEATARAAPPALLRLRFACRATLSRTRVSYLQHGGLYLPCEAQYPLRTRLCLLLDVAGLTPVLCLNATVAMSGPLPGVWAGRQGIAVAFDDNEARYAIDELLGGTRITGTDADRHAQVQPRDNIDTIAQEQ